MQFVYPGFLVAFLAVGIPVIIHLFHFRRFRKIYFPNVAFLQHLSDESHRQSRLRHLLVLASRILVISFLVLAFSRPFIPAGQATISQQGNVVAVYLDNSFSMGALAGRGSLLDQGRAHARHLVEMYQPGDRFLLLTNDFEGRHQRLVTRAEFLTMLEQVQESAALRTLPEVMQRKAELMVSAGEASPSSYYISDFQKSTSGIEELRVDSAIASFFIPLAAQQSGNVFIDSAWFVSPVKLLGQAVTLLVRIFNDTEQAMENQPLRLYLDGVQRAVASWDAPPGEHAEVELTWTETTAGFRQGRIEILDHPVIFDDHLFFSYSTSSDVPVLAINQGRPGSFLQALFGRDDTFSLENMQASAIDFSRLGQFNLIVLNNLNSISPGLARGLQQFTEQGGSLVVFPGQNLDQDSFGDFLASAGTDVYGELRTDSLRVTSLNEMHDVFTGVFDNIPENIDLPAVSRYYPIRRHASPAGEYLLQLQDGNYFFSSYSVGRGRIFLSSVPLDATFSNLVRHPVFVPIMANIALQSQALEPLYQVLGQDQAVLLRGRPLARDEIYQLRGQHAEIIPEHRHVTNLTRLFFHDQVNEAGNYMLYQAQQPLKGLSFNYDRRESLLEAYSQQELQDLLQDQGLQHIRIITTSDAGFEQALQQFRTGRQLWKHFLLLALALLLLEALLLRSRS